MTRTSSHQLLLVLVALAVVGALFALPKGIVKPKEGKGELAQTAARTANRDQGAAAPSTASVEGAAPAGASAEKPHMSATPTQQKELAKLRARYTAANASTKLQLASELAAKYAAVTKFDSAGYYYEQVAVARPGEQAWKKAADQYFEAFSFAATEERAKTLSAKARELYERVLKNNPDNLDAKTNLGMAYMASENPVQGVVLLREVLATDPRNEKALYNLGVLSLQSNQAEKAVERFRELVKYHPENESGQFYLGVSLAQTENRAEARKVFTQLKQNSTDPALSASVDQELQKLQ
ncbi:tetratricopeptide repeat protein [Hymenobacter guriensis]|uniref:tetratricopeptide repeat protein n=1 Tax=Hymenobacter guriensis TaxID=2793065 RepID=UPI001E523566|nr:tetratricopeptide repeat protein [Hymenobacter guriensis]